MSRTNCVEHASSLAEGELMPDDPGRRRHEEPASVDMTRLPPTEAPQSVASPTTLKDRAVTGVLWTAVQRWSVRLSTVVAFVLLGRLLQPEQFGVVALAMAFITLLTVVTDDGFSTYLVHVEGLTQRMKSTAFYLSVVVGFAAGGGLALAAHPLADLLDTEQLRHVLPALAVSVVLAGFASVPVALLTRELAFRSLMLRQVSATLVSVVAAVALAAAGAGVWALVAQTLVRTALSTVVLVFMSDFRPTREFSGSDARALAGYGSKSMSVRLLSQLRPESQVLFIGSLAGTVAVGLWTVANRLVYVAQDLCGSLVAGVARPVFARLQNDPPRLASALGRSAAAGMLIVVPVLLGLAVTSPVLVPFVFGEQWVRAAPVASILAAGGIAVAFSYYDRMLLLAVGRPGLELLVTIAVLLGDVVLLLALAPRGLEQVATGLVLWGLLTSVLRPWLVHRSLGIPWSAYAQVVRIVAAGAVAAMAVVALNLALEVDGAGLFGSALLGACVYAAGAWWLARDTVSDIVRSVVGVRRRRPARA